MSFKFYDQKFFKLFLYLENIDKFLQILKKFKNYFISLISKRVIFGRIKLSEE